MPTSIATLDGGRTSIDDALLEQLGTTMRGDVLKPGDPVLCKDSVDVTPPRARRT